VTRVLYQSVGSRTGRGHFARTLERPVAHEVLAGFLSPEDREALHRWYGPAPVPTWGMQPGKEETNARSAWSPLWRGDVAVFKGDGRIYASGSVVHKARHQGLASQLWGWAQDGTTWEYVFFLSGTRLLGGRAGYATASGGVPAAARRRLPVAVAP
jgi:hypothetical protein